jgi:hypothetical protein
MRERLLLVTFITLFGQYLTSPSLSCSVTVILNCYHLMAAKGSGARSWRERLVVSEGWKYFLTGAFDAKWLTYALIVVNS